MYVLREIDTRLLIGIGIAVLLALMAVSAVPAFAATTPKNVIFRQEITISGYVDTAGVSDDMHFEICDIDVEESFNVGSPGGSLDYRCVIDFCGCRNKPDPLLSKEKTISYHAVAGQPQGAISGQESDSMSYFNIAFGDLFQATDMELSMKFWVGKDAGVDPLEGEGRTWDPDTLSWSPYKTGTAPEGKYETGYEVTAAFTGQFGTGMKWLNPGLGVDLYSNNVVTGMAQVTYKGYASNQHPVPAEVIEVPKATWP